MWTLKPSGAAVMRWAIALQPVEVDAGLAAAVVVGEVLRRLEAGPAAVEPVGLVGDIGLAGLEFGLEALAPVGAHLVDFALR